MADSHKVTSQAVLYYQGENETWQLRDFHTSLWKCLALLSLLPTGFNQGNLLNSRAPFVTGFKRPISLTNYSEKEQFLSLLPKILFLASMPEASHSCRLPDTSFIFCVQSFLALLKELLT